MTLAPRPYLIYCASPSVIKPSSIPALYVKCLVDLVIVTWFHKVHSRWQNLSSTRGCFVFLMTSPTGGDIYQSSLSKCPLNDSVLSIVLSLVSPGSY
jgi:hypothetical protein